MPNYLVRLPMNLTADNPSAAVQAMIEELTNYGLRNWQYRVDLMHDNGELVPAGQFTGFGHSATEAPSEESGTIPEHDATDTELLQFAERLTQE